jgi:hypothetical protein
MTLARWRSERLAVPERLCRFVRSEWPAATWDDAARLWKDACFAWLAEHPDSLPFGEHGGELDVLRAMILYRERNPSAQTWRPATHWTNGAPPD